MFSTNTQSRFKSVVVDSVLGSPHRVLVSLEFCKQCKRRILKGAMNESETRELLGGREGNSVSPMRGLLRDFLQKGNRK